MAGQKTTVGDVVTSAAIGCAIGALFTLIGPAVDYVFGGLTRDQLCRRGLLLGTAIIVRCAVVS